MNTKTHLSSSEEQLRVSNLIHLRKNIELVKNGNWNTEWISWSNMVEKKKTIPKIQVMHHYNQKKLTQTSLSIYIYISNEVKRHLIYLLANFWWDILVGNPDLDIRTTSSTPQHLSCCNTKLWSYIPGDWKLLGLMQRIKCGVVVSKRCINWNNWPYKREDNML